MAEQSTTVDRIMQSKFWNLLLFVQRKVLLATSLIMIGILVGVVVMRYVLHADFFGYDELALVDSFWMYFIGASYAMYQKSHVKADIFANLFHKTGQLRLRIVSGFMQIALQLVFDVLAFNMIMRSLTTWPTTSSWRIPFIFPQLSIFIGFLLMTFYLVVYTWKDIDTYRSMRGAAV